MDIAVCTCHKWCRAWEDGAEERLHGQMQEHLAENAHQPGHHKIYTAQNVTGYELRADVVTIPQD